MSNLNYLSKKLEEINWDFASLGNEGLNSMHWYPATFISAIPGSIIPLLTNEQDIVLDTFCGTSVTGLEAIRLQRNYIGIDNNPVAILISKAKLLFPDKDRLKSLSKKIIENVLLSNNDDFSHPNCNILKQWYHPQTYSDLKKLLFFIVEVEDDDIRTVLLAVYSSILKNVSSQGKHWGWVCDNVKPKSEQIKYKDACDAFEKSIDDYLGAESESIKQIEARTPKFDRFKVRESWDLVCEDTISTMSNISAESIDLILTSPPYYGVVDYVKAQRLTFLWFDKSIIDIEGHGYDDFNNLRKKETGARSRRYNKNSHSNYVSYMKTYLDKCYKLLKNDAFLVLVIGDSKAREKTIEPINSYAIKKGFTETFESQRNILDTKRRLLGKVNNEQLLIFKK